MRKVCTVYYTYYSTIATEGLIWQHCSVGRYGLPDKRTIKTWVNIFKQTSPRKKI